MSISSKNVYNLNDLSGSHFTLHIHNYPNLNFTIQDVNLPSVFSTPIENPRPTGSFYVSQDKLSYEELVVSFIVDESLNNWREVYNWMRSLAPTHILGDDGLNQYKEKINSKEGLYSNATLFILTNSLNVNVKVYLKNIFPFALSGINFSVKNDDDVKLYSTVKFVYDYYDLEVSRNFNENAVPDNILDK